MGSKQTDAAKAAVSACESNTSPVAAATTPNANGDTAVTLSGPNGQAPSPSAAPASTPAPGDLGDLSPDSQQVAQRWLTMLRRRAPGTPSGSPPATVPGSISGVTPSVPLHPSPPAASRDRQGAVSPTPSKNQAPPKHTAPATTPALKTRPHPTKPTAHHRAAPPPDRLKHALLAASPPAPHHRDPDRLFVELPNARVSSPPNANPAPTLPTMYQPIDRTPPTVHSPDNPLALSAPSPPSALSPEPPGEDLSTAPSRRGLAWQLATLLEDQKSIRFYNKLVDQVARGLVGPRQHRAATAAMLIDKARQLRASRYPHGPIVKPAAVFAKWSRSLKKR